MTAQSRWGQHMDTFPGLVIYLALTALAKDPGLWAKFNNGRQHAIRAGRFHPPYDADVWKRLAELADPDIDLIAAKLKDCCQPGWVVAKTLQDTLKRNWWKPRSAALPRRP